MGDHYHSCASCRFGLAVAKSRRMLCRRLPPVAHPVLRVDEMEANDGATKADLMAARTAWPVTSSHDWCGEHRLRIGGE